MNSARNSDTFLSFYTLAFIEGINWGAIGVSPKSSNRSDKEHVHQDGGGGVDDPTHS